MGQISLVQIFQEGKTTFDGSYSKGLEILWGNCTVTAVLLSWGNCTVTAVYPEIPRTLQIKIPNSNKERKGICLLVTFTKSPFKDLCVKLQSRKLLSHNVRDNQQEM